MAAQMLTTADLQGANDRLYAPKKHWHLRAMTVQWYGMKKTNLPLPPPGSSMAMAVHRLEQISCAIQKSVIERKGNPACDIPLRTPTKAYSHFRRQAFEVLAHYVDNDLQAAFGWLVAMHGQAPRRRRGSVKKNEFHLGLLAMSAAAGTFMSLNRIRDLARNMQDAYERGIEPADFNNHVVRARKQDWASREPVTAERAEAITRRAMERRRMI